MQHVAQNGYIIHLKENMTERKGEKKKKKSGEKKNGDRLRGLAA